MSRRGSFRLVGGDPDVRRDDPEPSLYALLDDPVMKLLLGRDGVHRTELLFMIEVARMRLRAQKAAAHVRPSVAVSRALEYHA